MDETSGTTAAESSGEGGAITLVNTEDADWVSGKNGNCIALDGSNERGTAASNSSYSGGDMSMGAWVNLAATSAFRTIFTSGKYFTSSAAGGGNGNFILRITNSHTTPQLTFYLYDATSAKVTGTYQWGTGSISTGTWYHAMLVHRDSANGVELYWNGSSLGTVTVTSDLQDITNNGFHVGVQWYSGGSVANYWAGNIDDIRLYNVALSDSEVAEIYNSGDGDW